ncbi:hypothetical protein SNEBB_006062 [Seison nebaliae]|nr:hypothetical protein SNEBB_006062 [Seison nebaliae]
MSEMINKYYTIPCYGDLLFYNDYGNKITLVYTNECTITYTFKLITPDNLEKYIQLLYEQLNGKAADVTDVFEVDGECHVIIDHNRLYRIRNMKSISFIEEISNNISNEYLIYLIIQEKNQNLSISDQNDRTIKEIEYLFEHLNLTEITSHKTHLFWNELSNLLENYRSILKYEIWLRSSIVLEENKQINLLCLLIMIFQISNDPVTTNEYINLILKETSFFHQLHQSEMIDEQSDNTYNYVEDTCMAIYHVMTKIDLRILTRNIIKLSLSHNEICEKIFWKLIFQDILDNSTIYPIVFHQLIAANILYKDVNIHKFLPSKKTGDEKVISKFDSVVWLLVSAIIEDENLITASTTIARRLIYFSFHSEIQSSNSPKRQISTNLNILIYDTVLQIIEILFESNFSQHLQSFYMEEVIRKINLPFLITLASMSIICGNLENFFLNFLENQKRKFKMFPIEELTIFILACFNKPFCTLCSNFLQKYENFRMIEYDGLTINFHDWLEMFGRSLNSKGTSSGQRNSKRKYKENFSSPKELFEKYKLNIENILNPKDSSVIHNGLCELYSCCRSNTNIHIDQTCKKLFLKLIYNQFSRLSDDQQIHEDKWTSIICIIPRNISLPMLHLDLTTDFPSLEENISKLINSSLKHLAHHDKIT